MHRCSHGNLLTGGTQCHLFVSTSRATRPFDAMMSARTRGGGRRMTGARAPGGRPVGGSSEEKSYCRLCQANCGVVVTVEDERILRVRGDRYDPVSRGYICFKGRQAPEQHHGDRRLLRSLVRAGDELVEG